MSQFAAVSSSNQQDYQGVHISHPSYVNSIYISIYIYIICIMYWAAIYRLLALVYSSKCTNIYAHHDIYVLLYICICKLYIWEK